MSPVAYKKLCHYLFNNNNIKDICLSIWTACILW